MKALTSSEKACKFFSSIWHIITEYNCQAFLQLGKRIDKFKL
jgi:hypothetical protein